MNSILAKNRGDKYRIVFAYKMHYSSACRFLSENRQDFAVTRNRNIAVYYKSSKGRKPQKGENLRTKLAKVLMKWTE